MKIFSLGGPNQVAWGVWQAPAGIEIIGVYVGGLN